MNRSSGRALELPPNWIQASLQDICAKITDGTHNSPTNAPSGDFLYITAKNVRNWRLDLSDVAYVGKRDHEAIYARCDVRRGDVLYVKDGVNTGMVAVNTLNEPFSLLSSVGVFRPCSAVVAEYLMYALSCPSVKQTMMAGIAGVAITRLTLTKLRSAQVPIPPLCEQRRIVAKIEELFTRLDAGVAALQAVKQQIKRYRQAVLKAACEGHLLGHAYSHRSFLECNWKTIDLALSSLGQGWSPGCDSAPSESHDVWGVIKTTAVQPMGFLDVENKRLPGVLQPRPALEINEGDLLVTRAGPRSRVGISCLVRRTRPHLMVCDKVYRLRCNPDVSRPAYLELVLNAPQVVDAINDLKTGISDSGVNLTHKRFLGLRVPFPPLETQRQLEAEVARHFSLADFAEKAVDESLAKADHLRQSILKQAFEGRLVPQDPNDEPAGKLLERIKAARYAASRSLKG